MNFEVPSEIQEKIIPLVLSGFDVIGQSKTGSGKTAAFGIPIIEMLNPSLNKIQAVIMAPTRELAIQVTKELNHLGKYKKIRVVTIYGGQNIKTQFKALSKTPHIIVCTPGRLIDHLERGTIKLNRVEIFTIDEADKMLEMGFLEDIERIMDMLPNHHQTLMFSATMPDEIIELSEKYMTNTKVVKVSSDEMSVEHIRQVAYKLHPSQKFKQLMKVLRENSRRKILVFTNTKIRGERLSRKLKKYGFFVRFMSGDLSQNQRERHLSWFRQPGSRILVASDVASRGLDVIDVNIVINYDFPKYDRLYVHRIGRTGRFDRSGMAISFVTASDLVFFEKVQEKNKVKVIRMHHDSDFGGVKTIMGYKH